MDICFIYRKKNELFFSIEKVFSSVLPFITKRYKTGELILSHHTQGIVSVVKNLLLMRRNSAAVYHITGDVHYVALGLPRSKTILTIHDCVFLENYSGFKRTFLKWLLLDMPVKRAAIVTTISENTRRDIIQFSKCAPGKVVVIPNPVNAQIYYSPRTFDSQQPVVLFIGSTPNKNLERVIKALEGISCNLIIIGKVSATQGQLLNEAGVRFKAHTGLSEEQIARMYAESDIVLFPSTYEGFGLPIIEGQKAGRVVITSNIQPMKEVAGGGACIVDPLNVQSIQDGIVKVIRNAAFREQLIREGFQNIARYEASKIAEQYMQLYQRIINH